MCPDVAHTPFLNVIIQRHNNDCSVACLAMLLGLSYEQVMVAFKHNVVRHGSTIRQLQGACRTLGRKLVWSRRLGDLETDTGVLCVRSSKWPHDHLVVLKEGMIIDTDATVWEQDVFLAAYEAKPVSILRLEEGR